MKSQGMRKISPFKQRVLNMPNIGKRTKLPASAFVVLHRKMKVVLVNNTAITNPKTLSEDFTIN